MLAKDASQGQILGRDRGKNLILLRDLFLDIAFNLVFVHEVLQSWLGYE
jgi:hypothetical protein